MKSDNFLIFQPAKSAMQSGIGKSEKWCLSNSVANETFINSVFVGLEVQIQKEFNTFLIR